MYYLRDIWDVEIYSECFGWVECVGIVNRGDYDLSRYMCESGVDLIVFIYYDELKIVKKFEVSFNMKRVGLKLKKDVKRINELIKGWGEEKKCELVEFFEKEGKVMIEGYEFEKDDFIIREVEEKIIGEKIVLYVFELSFGIDRFFYLFFENSFVIEEDRIYLRIKKDMVLIEVVVLLFVVKELFKSIVYDIFRMF